MADWLHANGHEVAHVDVRPADGVPATAYPVLTSATGAIHDEAGRGVPGRVGRRRRELSRAGPGPGRAELRRAGLRWAGSAVRAGPGRTELRWAGPVPVPTPAAAAIAIARPRACLDR